jgi:hypothetical protein
LQSWQIERELLVDHRPDRAGIDQLSDLGELPAIGPHEQERVVDAALLRFATDLETRQPQHLRDEPARADLSRDGGIGWTGDRHQLATGLEHLSTSSDFSSTSGPSVLRTTS